jgi:hypothetical protein
MPVPKTSKIYKILCPTDPDCVPYIGSTNKNLLRRFSGHKYWYSQWKQGKHNNCGSFALFDKYGVDSCLIELIEKHPFMSQNDLRAKEEVVRQSFSKTTNMISAYGTNEAWKQRHREYNNVKGAERVQCPWCNETLRRDSLRRHKNKYCLKRQQESNSSSISAISASSITMINPKIVIHLRK